MCIWLIRQFTLYSHETSGVTVSNPLHISQIYTFGWGRTVCNLPPSLPQFAVFWYSLSLPAESCGLHFLENHLILQPKPDGRAPPPSYSLFSTCLCVLSTSLCMSPRKERYLHHLVSIATIPIMPLSQQMSFNFTQSDVMSFLFLFILVMVHNLSYYKKKQKRKGWKSRIATQLHNINRKRQ